MAAERNDDDIAAALHGLNAGHHDSTAEHAGSVHGEQVDMPAPATPAKRPAAPPARPAVPLPPRPEPRASQASPPRPAQSGSPSRPAAPVRPAVPGQPSAYEQEVFDDGDDTVLNDVAATPLDYRGTKPAPTRPRKPPMFKTLGFRRTVIPVLLCTGLMMLVMFVARSFVDEEAPLAHLPSWIGATLLVTGIVLVALAILNMLLVRGELAKRQAKAKA